MRSPIPWDLPRTPFTLANAAHLGVTERQVRGALSRGHLVRLRRGVFVAAEAVPEDPATLHVMRALAHQLVVPSLVASEETAALALGLSLPWADRAAAGPLRFTRSGCPSMRSRPGGRVSVRLADLPREHVVTLPCGLQATSWARTGVDLAARLGAPDALMVLDSAARKELESQVGTLSRTVYRRSGTCSAVTDALAAVARRVLPPYLLRRVQPVLGMVDVRHETPIESVGAAHFHLAGFPESVPQAEIATDAGVFAVDRMFRGYGVIVEFDGEVKYADSRAFIREKEREWFLRDQGHEVVRCTGREILARPHVMLERTARALRARGWSG